jgi:hypothetical protein
MLAAALDVVGLAYVMDATVTDHVKSGRLVRVPGGLVPAVHWLLSLLSRQTPDVADAAGADTATSINRIMLQDIAASDQAGKPVRRAVRSRGPRNANRDRAPSGVQHLAQAVCEKLSLGLLLRELEGLRV